MKVDMSDEEILEYFRKLRMESTADDVAQFELWALHKLHKEWRDGILTDKDFARLMDEVVCW